MNKIYKFGIFCEELAEKFLIKKGYEILAKRFRHKKGEIDLIASINSLIIFVEVKGRKNNFFGNPETFVDEKKSKLIMKVAEQYIESKNINSNIRFDVISIIGDFKNYKILHIEDAFY